MERIYFLFTRIKILELCFHKFLFIFFKNLYFSITQSGNIVEIVWVIGVIISHYLELMNIKKTSMISLKILVYLYITFIGVF